MFFEEEDGLFFGIPREEFGAAVTGIFKDKKVHGKVGFFVDRFKSCGLSDQDFVIFLP